MSNKALDVPDTHDQLSLEFFGLRKLFDALVVVQYASRNMDRRRSHHRYILRPLRLLRIFHKNPQYPLRYWNLKS